MLNEYGCDKYVGRRDKGEGVKHDGQSTPYPWSTTYAIAANIMTCVRNKHLILHPRCEESFGVLPPTRKLHDKWKVRRNSEFRQECGILSRDRERDNLLEKEGRKGEAAAAQAAPHPSKFCLLGQRAAPPLLRSGSALRLDLDYNLPPPLVPSQL